MSFARLYVRSIERCALLPMIPLRGSQRRLISIRQARVQAGVPAIRQAGRRLIIGACVLTTAFLVKVCTRAEYMLLRASV